MNVSFQVHYLCLYLKHLAWVNKFDKAKSWTAVSRSLSVKQHSFLPRYCWMQGVRWPIELQHRSGTVGIKEFYQEHIHLDVGLLTTLNNMKLWIMIGMMMITVIFWIRIISIYKIATLPFTPRRFLSSAYPVLGCVPLLSIRLFSYIILYSFSKFRKKHVWKFACYKRSDYNYLHNCFSFSQLWPNKLKGDRMFGWHTQIPAVRTCRVDKIVPKQVCRLFGFE